MPKPGGGALRFASGGAQFNYGTIPAGTRIGKATLLSPYTLARIQTSTIGKEQSYARRALGQVNIQLKTAYSEDARQLQEQKRALEEYQRELRAELVRRGNVAPSP